MKESEEKRIYTVKSQDVEIAYFLEEFAPEIYQNVRRIFDIEDY